MRALTTAVYFKILKMVFRCFFATSYGWNLLLFDGSVMVG